MDKLDYLVERINQTKFVQNARPFHWLILGATIMFLINTALGISIAIADFFTYLTLEGIYWISTLLLGEEGGIRFIKILQETEESDPVFITDMISWTFDLMFAFINGMALVGHDIWGSFEISFPMLKDIDLDLDWLHLSLPDISRSVFAFLQFVILYYILRRIRRALKNRIERRISFLNYDYFDKKFYEVTVV